MYCVDVDTGGTMTDTLVSGGTQPLTIKVESTPHDVTVSFMQSLSEAAERLGFADLGRFLEEVRVIRWSSTITSNVLAERRGPKLGLVVSPGHAADLYADDPADAATVVPTLVRAEHIAELPADADRGTIVAVVKQLIDQGIRRISISLAGAFPDGSREADVLKVIGEQFPDHFLGSVPALAGSEMLMQPDDMSRTFYSLINAYVHNALANSLFKAEDQLKVDHQWRGDLLVGHLNGGVARIGKTKAVDTIESGPLFGTHGSAHVAAANHDQRVVAMDIGGTTGKASAITNGRVEMRSEGHIFGIPVRMPMPVLRSNALGGGSIARVENGAVRLGPDSMGAAPGPACYALGGTQATLTDALVVLGLISPVAFLDGRRALDVALASTAIEQHVAHALGVDSKTAARNIVDCAVSMMADLARQTIDEVSWDSSGEVTLYAFGGNGPVFGSLVAEVLGLRRIRLFALGTVFSAYGSAISDVLHVYERALTDSSKPESLSAAGSAMLEQARRDLQGEGFDPGMASYAWTLQSAARERIRIEGTLEDVAPALARSVAEGSLLRLDARFPLGAVELPQPPVGPVPEPHSQRQSPLSLAGTLPVYAHDTLRGHTLDGPLVVDGGTFTWFVSAGWRLVVDAAGDALLTREETR